MDTSRKKIAGWTGYRPYLTRTTWTWAEDELLGGVTFIGDVKYYASGGTVSENVDCSGIRLLVVKPEARKLGIGKALTKACIQSAKEIGTSQIVLHTTNSMEVAWKMYEGMGFLRSPNLDFSQGEFRYMDSV